MSQNWRHFINLDKRFREILKIEVEITFPVYCEAGVARAFGAYLDLYVAMSYVFL